MIAILLPVHRPFCIDVTTELAAGRGTTQSFEPMSVAPRPPAIGTECGASSCHSASVPIIERTYGISFFSQASAGYCDRQPTRTQPPHHYGGTKVVGIPAMSGATGHVHRNRCVVLRLSTQCDRSVPAFDLLPACSQPSVWTRQLEVLLSFSHLYDAMPVFGGPRDQTSGLRIHTLKNRIRTTSQPFAGFRPALSGLFGSVRHAATRPSFVPCVTVNIGMEIRDCLQ